MHVDGFRFDLASILARDPLGQLIANPPVLWDIESDPVLAGTSSSRRPGTPPACIKWAALSGTAGRNGTDASATMPGVSSEVKKA